MQSKYLNTGSWKKNPFSNKSDFFVYLSNKCLLSQAFCWPLEIGKKQNNYTHARAHTHTQKHGTNKDKETVLLLLTD